MRIRTKRSLLVSVVAGGLVSAAQAQTLTTAASNNGSGGVFMDLTPASGALLVTSFDSYFSSTAGGASTIEVWTRPGTYVGFDASSAGWTLVDTVSATSAGTTTLAPITLNNPIALPSAATTAVYLQGVSGQTLRYTGTSTIPPQTTWSNADLTLFSDVARTGSVSFGGTRNTPRTFAGVVHYVPSDPTPGACCLSDGTCTSVSQAACISQGGTFGGASSPCATANCPQPAACCFPNGSCTVVLQTACTAQGGVFNSAAATCATANCPQPATGACCLGFNTCSILNTFDCTAQNGLYRGDNTTCAAGNCTHYPEVEPNSLKAEATAVTLLNGQGVRGISTGTTATAGSTVATTVDYFKIKTAPAALGIYRHELALNSSTPANSSWIRGLSQTAAAAGPWPGPVGTATTTDNAGQAHLLEGTRRVNSWYGFGKEEEIYYRVAGTTSSTANYVAELTTTPVTPTSLGSFAAGTLIINTSGQTHTNDTVVRVFDSNLVPVPGYMNDEATTFGGAPAPASTSFLRREYAAGTYYLAISMVNLSTNQGTPCDDGFLTGFMMDFPNVAVNGSTSTLTDLSFSITDRAGTTAFPASRTGAGHIAWFSFTVTGTPVVGGCCYADGSCTQVTQLHCSTSSGTYAGDNVTCVAANCPQPPTGGCCLPVGGCSILSAIACTAQGGVYAGDNTTCTNPNCGNVVVPNANATVEGASNNNIPFSSTTTHFHYQQVYAASEFAGLSGPHRIRGMQFRPNATSTNPVWQQTMDIDLRFSTTAAAPDALSTTFTANVGPDSTQVYSGPVTISTTQVTPITPGPALFDIVINFQNPFVYNPANGNLLMDVIVNGTTIGTARAMDAVAVTGDSVSRMHSTTVGATTGTAATTGLVTRFLVEPVATPCYPNCDGSTVAPILNVGDFTCFLQRFAAGESYANCDNSTIPPVLNVGDFTCFLQSFAAGCR
jgi:hypothetical protein